MTQSGAPPKAPDVFGDFVTMFEEAFGLALDKNVELKLELIYALHGGKQEVEFEHLVACTACNGSGAAMGSAVVDCTDCYGEGTVDRTHRYFTATIPCPGCFGKKRKPDVRCAACAGAGRVPKREKVVVKIPTSVEDGFKLRLAGKGHLALDGTKSGDLYLVVRVDFGPFRRVGADLHLDVPVDRALTTRGGRMKIPLADGSREVALRPGMKDGDEVRIPGQGSPRPGVSAVDTANARGDLVVRFVFRDENAPAPMPSMPPQPQQAQGTVEAAWPTASPAGMSESAPATQAPGTMASPADGPKVSAGVRAGFAVAVLLGLGVASVGVLHPRTWIVAVGLALTGLASLAMILGHTPMLGDARQRSREAGLSLAVLAFTTVSAKVVTHVLLVHLLAKTVHP